MKKQLNKLKLFEQFQKYVKKSLIICELPLTTNDSCRDNFYIVNELQYYVRFTFYGRINRMLYL